MCTAWEKRGIMYDIKVFTLIMIYAKHTNDCKIILKNIRKDMVYSP